MLWAKLFLLVKVGADSCLVQSKAETACLNEQFSRRCLLMVAPLHKRIAFSLRT
jgi:hypothetical protein